jgi:cytochrome c5
MTKILLFPLAIVAGFAPAAGLAQAPKPGETVYKEVCIACHATGLEKAPKLGDRKAWAPLIKEGQVTLTVDAWAGVRAMPPKGGKADLSLEEFARAVAYMAREGGAKWQDPDAAMLKRMQAADQRRAAKAAAKK